MESSMFQGYTLDPPPDLGVLPQALRALFLVGDRRSQCLLPFVPLGYRVTTNPNPFPTRCMRGDVYVAPGLPYGNRRR